MIKTKNLLKNSSCEEFEYGNDGSIKLKNWINIYSKKISTPGARISSKHAHSGMYSIEVDAGYHLQVKLPALKKNHSYIWLCNTYLDSIHDWELHAASFSVDSDFEEGAIGTFTMPSIRERVYCDDFILMDLTETFTDEGIPSIGWLASIPYHDNEIFIHDEKVVNILNLNDFVQNPENGIYYNDNDSVTFRFSIENFDKKYNENINNACKTRISLLESYKEDDYYIEDYNGNDRKLTTIYYGDEGFNEDNILYIKENSTYYFEVTLQCDPNSIGRQIEILGDSNLLGKQLVSYTVFNWRNTKNFNVLNTNVEFNLITDSPYMRTIQGETNPYLLAPTSINIYVNDHIVPNTLVTERTNYENMKFEKQLFLKDGANKVKIQAINIYGKVINEKEYDINVEFNTSVVAKENLLTNFIANDDQMIELKMDNVYLAYHNKNAGMSKEVYIDKTITNHFFNLEGINSQYYRIDRNEVPKIYGDIIRRPINVTFNGVEKIYDGDPNISIQLKELQFDDGYTFNTIQDKHMSYSNTGFLRGSYENLYIKTIAYKQNDIVGPINEFYNKETNETIYYSDYIINSDNINFDSFEIFIDNDEGKTMSNGDIIIESIAKKEEKLIDAKITKSKMLHLLDSKKETGVYYTIYKSTLNQVEKLYGIAYYGYENSFGGINIETFELIDGDVNNLEKMKIKLENWLKAIDHKIYKVKLYVDELNATHLIFLYNSDKLSYTVNSEIAIKYKYKNKLNVNTATFKNADTNKVFVKFDSAYFDNKNVSTEWKPIAVKDLQLTGGINGDESKNYVISSYSAYGRITKRGVIPHITCLDKIYDGTSYVPFNLDSSEEFYNGIENTISGDDVYIDNTYYGIHDNNFHLFKQTGLSYLEFNDSKVEENKQVKRNPNIILEGKDASNYYISAIKCNYIASIKPRKIEVVIDKLRFIRSALKWEIDYHFINNIPQDHLTLSVNDKNGFKVYGGKSTLDEQYEIADRFDILANSVEDIIDMYFTYEFNADYKFNNVEDNGQLIEVYEPENTNTLYWTNEARVAEPNTKRIDINIESDNNYPGEIKIKSSDLPYFESKDKQYRLYNHNKVFISGLNLDPENNISNNYELLNKTYITTIEII